MKTLRAWIPLGLVLALCLTGFSAAAASAPATVPTWQVGQAVGYGTSVNLTTLFDTYVRPLITANPSSMNITSINTLDFTGSFDSWTYDHVAQATSTYYVLDSQSATGLQFHLNVNLTLQGLPTAGSYTGTPTGYGTCIPAAIPTTTKTVAVVADGKVLAETTSAIYQQVSDLAYINETTAATVNANVALKAYNIPTPSTNTTTCVETVSYESPSFTLSMDTQDQVRMLFQPAWNYFDFPISDNKTWWANTTATVGATLSGTVNVQGLSSQDQAAFFDNLTKTFRSAGLAVSGLSSFPIDLSKVTIGAGLTNIVNNGVVTDLPLPLNEEFRAIASAKTLSDNSVHPVYLITSASYECPTSSLSSLPVGYAAVYAPDFPAPGAGMIVGYQLLVCLGSTNLPGYELTNTAPADAQKNIGQTETTYNPTPPAAPNALADFFTQSPYWGLLLLVAVVVVVAALLVVRRRHRRTAVPPPPPPPGTP